MPPQGAFRRAQCKIVSPKLGALLLQHTPAGMTHSSPVAGEPGRNMIAYVIVSWLIKRCIKIYNFINII